MLPASVLTPMLMHLVNAACKCIFEELHLGFRVYAACKSTQLAPDCLCACLVQDHGKTSATASLGMITLWDVEGGLPQIDKYLYSRDNHVVAGKFQMHASCPGPLQAHIRIFVQLAGHNTSLQDPVCKRHPHAMLQ